MQSFKYRKTKSPSGLHWADCDRLLIAYLKCDMSLDDEEGGNAKTVGQCYVYVA